MTYQWIEPEAALKEFISSFGASVDVRLWDKLVDEEIEELRQAEANNEGVEAVLKELCDVMYVVTGMTLIGELVDDLIPEEEVTGWGDKFDVIAKEVEAIVYSYGFVPEQMNHAFRRVHESNMSKLGDDGKPIKREDGKIMKGPNYKAPDLSDLV